MKRIEISEEYFEEVIKAEEKFLFRLSYNIVHNIQDAEDAVSESVLKAWEKRSKVREPDKLKQWLVQIVINTSKTMLKKRSRMVPCEEVAQTEYKEEGGNIWYWVEELKEKERIVVILYYYREFSVKEIARILHIPEGTVKSRLSKARGNLKKMLEGGNGNE
ncbi:MAG: sigma-70 family RNA polymerase sigma factor [Lachnospiraceae bacterium]|nr:sigma-70 family RNA polymerase sigma factor [Lachnospiraceae bacterium]